MDDQRPTTPRRSQVEIIPTAADVGKSHPKSDSQNLSRQNGSVKKGNRLLKMLRTQKDKVQMEKNNPKRNLSDETIPHVEQLTHTDYAKHCNQSLETNPDALPHVPSNQHRQNYSDEFNNKHRHNSQFSDNHSQVVCDVTDTISYKKESDSPAHQVLEFEEEPPSDYMRFIKAPRQSQKSVVHEGLAHDAKKKDAIPVVKSFFELREEVC